MKKLVLNAAAFFLVSQALCQQFQLDCIPFDTSTGGVINGGANNWFVNPTFQNGSPSNTSAPNAYRDTVPPGAPGTNAYFSTPSYDCSANGYVSFQFNHICKIPAAQRATIEVSVNGAGGPWVALNSTHYRSQFFHPNSFSSAFSANGYFSSASYPTTWLPAQPFHIPDSSWWKNEIFDISAIAGNQADVRIRFKLTNFDGTGAATRDAGWFIDDFCIQVAQGIPPVINLVQTNAGNITLGPFNFLFQIPNTGTGCCNSVSMYYSVNGNPYQTLNLVNTAIDLWTCTIPAQSDSDVICYFIAAQDWTFSEGYYPPSFIPYASPGAPFSIQGAVNCFVASAGIHYPYFENFDNSDGGWYVDSLIQASYWEWGIPNVGFTSGCYSPPYCWDVDLNQGYVSNTHTYLYTPPFTVSGAIPILYLSFWRNHYMQTAHDGMRLEYSFSGGPWTTLGTVGDTNGTNWYDTTIAGSLPTLKEGWTGNTAGTWIRSTYVINQLIGLNGNLEFRFVFDSDNFGNLDGVSIDDFYIATTPTGIPLVEGPALIQLYPNPTQGKLEMVFNTPLPEPGEVVVVNLLGQEVWKRTLEKADRLTIDLSSQPDGIYIVRLSSGNLMESRKIVLSRGQE